MTTDNAKDTRPAEPGPSSDFAEFARWAWDEHALYLYREPRLPEAVSVVARSLRVGHARGTVAVRPGVPLDEARAAVARLAAAGDTARIDYPARPSGGAS